MNRTCQDAEKPKARDMDVGMARSMGKLHETAAATPFGAGNSIAAKRGTDHCGRRAWAAAAFACFFGKAPRGQLGGRDGAGGAHSGRAQETRKRLREGAERKFCHQSLRCADRLDNRAQPDASAFPAPPGKPAPAPTPCSAPSAPGRSLRGAGEKCPVW